MTRIKKTICWIKGHDYSYNFGWMPTKCTCKRCGMKWKTVNNPEYIPGKSNPLETDIYTWIEDDGIESKQSIDTNWDNEPDLMS
jgi:hypothetical protein